MDIRGSSLDTAAVTIETQKDAEFDHFKQFIVHLLFDTAKNLALLMALSIIFFCVKWLETLGMTRAHTHHIQELHFWLSYASLLWIGVIFLLNLVKGSFK